MFRALELFLPSHTRTCILYICFMHVPLLVMHFRGIFAQVMFREDMATFKKRVRQTVRKSQEDM